MFLKRTGKIFPPFKTAIVFRRMLFNFIHQLFFQGICFLGRTTSSFFPALFLSTATTTNLKKFRCDLNRFFHIRIRHYIYYVYIKLGFISFSFDELSIFVNFLNPFSKSSKEITLAFSFLPKILLKWQILHLEKRFSTSLP